MTMVTGVDTDPSARLLLRSEPIAPSNNVLSQAGTRLKLLDIGGINTVITSQMMLDRPSKETVRQEEVRARKPKPKSRYFKQELSSS